MSVRIGVTGATGRMGREVIGLAVDRPDVSVVLAVSRDPDGEAVDGVEVSPAEDLEALVEDREPHVLVDFTAPEATEEYATLAGDRGVAFVSGTTGLDASQEGTLDEAAESVPVLHASNFSRGIATLRAAVADAVAELPAYDVEVIETHHRGKRDAPSGTASDLVDAVEEARDGRTGDRVHGRSGHAPRSEGEVGVHSVRAGAVTGEHVVVLAGNDEQLRLEHRAGDRRTFAAGALDAAEWLTDRDPGRYDLGEVGR